MALTSDSQNNDSVMMDASNVNHSDQHQQPESRMAVAELLVSLSHSSRGDEQPDLTALATNIPETTGEPSQPSPIYKNAVDYVCSVKKAYESHPRVYTEFLSALEKYHGMSLPLDQLVQTVMTLFQDQPELLMGFKEFLPESQGLLNQLVPPMMYSDYKDRTPKAPTQAASQTTIPSTMLGVSSVEHNNTDSPGIAAADFLSIIKERSQQEPDMYQHMINLLRKFQKDNSYSTLYFYISIVLRYHPHLLQRFQNFLPKVPSNLEVKEPKIISKAPPEELVVSPDFIEAKDFIQTVKFEAKNEMSMYDRFISALEKYQLTGWTIDQVYSEVSLIFWNHPDALAGFKRFIATVPQQP
ncbi:hypothetical protein BGZ80_009224 [Entomortierella chlamydospora]|uniref:Uncharacterized protein n=1 Tax=Entomortierella chlamydospora TaxID=101097 RepID=A0A9P6MWN7_9FUNG|nr:hypothetical protein BGZ79_009849 [Entomortierella chlamydospora]KAG0016457.1 hypothetical protein BGZ80_009224 [Entomortierella chlamydospora]